MAKGKEYLSQTTSQRKETSERKEALERQQALMEKMERIGLFPGSLQEYSQLAKNEYQLIDIPGNKKFLEGGLARWEVDAEKPATRPAKLKDFLNPFQWKHIETTIPNPYNPDPYHEGELYSQVLRQAAELGADALIYYTNNNDYPYRRIETGVPIKRVIPPQATK